MVPHRTKAKEKMNQKVQCASPSQQLWMSSGSRWFLWVQHALQDMNVATFALFSVFALLGPRQWSVTFRIYFPMS